MKAFSPTSLLRRLLTPKTRPDEECSGDGRASGRAFVPSASSHAARVSPVLASIPDASWHDEAGLTEQLHRRKAHRESLRDMRRNLFT